MICPRCGAEMTPKQRYCMKCGALNYDHPDNQKMKTYITPEEFDKANQDYNDPTKHEVDTVEFAGRTYETKTKNKKGFIDTKSAVLLLLLMTIILGGLAYFWLNYSLSFIIVVCLIYFIMTFYVIVNAAIYMKGGYSGFTPLIPFYSQYAYFDIAVGNGWNFLLVPIPIFGPFYALYANYRLGRVFGKSGWLTLFFPFIMLPIIALNDRTVYEGNGEKYPQFVTSGKRRNAQIPAFVYSLCFFLAFLSFAFTPSSDLCRELFYVNDVNSLVNTVNTDVVDGIYNCDGNMITEKDGEYYIPFSNASDLTMYSFIPIRSSMNGGSLEGYIRVVKTKKNYQYYVTLTDGEYGFDNVNSRLLSPESIEKMDSVEVPENVTTCKKD